MKWFILVLMCCVAGAQDPADEYALGVGGITMLLTVDETSGTTAADASGNGNSGTYVGSVSLGASAVPSEVSSGARAVGLDGSGARIEVSVLPGFNFVGLDGLSGTADDVPRSFTLSMWIEIDEAGGLECDGVIDGASGIALGGAANSADDIYLDQTCWPLWRKGNGLAGSVVQTAQRFTVGADLLPFTADDGVPFGVAEIRFTFAAFDAFNALGSCFPEIVLDVGSFNLAAKHLVTFRYDTIDDTAWIVLDEGYFAFQMECNYTQTADALRIGTAAAGVVTAGFDGLIDGVALYLDTALDPLHIVTTYYRGIAGEEFIRGDTNGDLSVNIADVFALLSNTACREASDANGDGAANISDVVYLAGYLFSSGPAPVAPFPSCDMETVEDALTCLEGCP